MPSKQNKHRELNIPQSALEDPRIDPEQLRKVRWLVTTTGIDTDDAKVGRDVIVDGEKIGYVYAKEALLATYGPDAPKAWYRSDSHGSDRYADPILAAWAMISDRVLNRCTPDHWPVSDKWAAENHLGKRFASWDEFFQWADENSWPYKKVGVVNPTHLPVSFIRE